MRSGVASTPDAPDLDAEEEETLDHFYQDYVCDEDEDTWDGESPRPRRRWKAH